MFSLKINPCPLKVNVWFWGYFWLLMPRQPSNVSPYPPYHATPPLIAPSLSSHNLKSISLPPLSCFCSNNFYEKKCCQKISSLTKWIWIWKTSQRATIIHPTSSCTIPIFSQIDRTPGEVFLKKKTSQRATMMYYTSSCAILMSSELEQQEKFTENFCQPRYFGALP